MKYAVILLAATLFVPTVLAGTTTQSGMQTGTGWSESTFISVNPGTEFSLSSATADFDIFFYNANGGFVGASIICGNDAGLVPSTAVTGEISKWDNTGAIMASVLPCAKPVLGLPGLPAVWEYTDG